MIAQACPCDLGRTYETCCGRYHAGSDAPTAAELMRARYSAYTLSDEPYLIATWDPATCPSGVGFGQEWLGLNVQDTAGGTVFDEEGTVTFTAEFATPDGVRRLHEVSQFRKIDGRWVYVSALDATIDALDT